MLHKLTRLLHTLKYLQIKQLVFYIARRCFTPALVTHKGRVELRPDFKLDQPLPVTGVWLSGDKFNFLNISKIQLLQAFEWCPEGVPRLWRYNLHYFDYLREPSRSDDEKIQLLVSWVACNPQGSQPGWEPFTVSLRIVNWVIFLSRCSLANTPAILRSLYIQTLWLEKNDERHILANHYFENLKALTFAGTYFFGMDAERWLKKGIRGIQSQLFEQTLADGGHYERTPQYHGLMLENYLDLYNLALNNPTSLDDNFVTLLKCHCTSGLVFYQSIQFPDQRLPLFNDTAFGISPSLFELDGYFQRLSTEPGCLRVQADMLFSQKASGLFGFRSSQDMFIIDAGDIGPSYQPGHTHCDMLSYELMLAGQRVVVDTGVCEYEPGPVRRYVRSTRAHNTVSVDGAEQSEVWGEFRVARRAKILSAHIERQDSTIVFEGAYQGFHCVSSHVQHYRKALVNLASDDVIQSLTVIDIITGYGEHQIESFIHLHPGFTVSDQGGGVIDLLGEDGLSLQLILEPGNSYHFEECYYCPEFGVKIPNICVVLKKSCTLPCELTYTIRIKR